jgi:hypothetical protein
MLVICIRTNDSSCVAGDFVASLPRCVRAVRRENLSVAARRRENVEPAARAFDADDRRALEPKPARARFDHAVRLIVRNPHVVERLRPV